MHYHSKLESFSFWPFDQIQYFKSISAKSSANLLYNHFEIGNCVIIQLFCQLMKSQERFILAFWMHYTKTAYSAPQFILNSLTAIANTC